MGDILWQTAQFEEDIVVYNGEAITVHIPEEYWVGGLLDLTDICKEMLNGKD